MLDHRYRLVEGGGWASIDSQPHLRHSVGMLTRISYDKNHSSKWAGALWLVWSVANAKWFARQSTLTKGSAVFYLKSNERPEDSLLRVLWDIEDHHPRVEEFQIEGLVLANPQFNALCDSLQLEGFGITKCRQGFMVTRRGSSAGLPPGSVT